MSARNANKPGSHMDGPEISQASNRREEPDGQLEKAKPKIIHDIRTDNYRLRLTDADPGNVEKSRE